MMELEVFNVAFEDGQKRAISAESLLMWLQRKQFESSLLKLYIDSPEEDVPTSLSIAKAAVTTLQELDLELQKALGLVSKQSQPAEEPAEAETTQQVEQDTEVIEPEQEVEAQEDVPKQNVVRM
jgi:hypothetical protein